METVNKWFIQPNLADSIFKIKVESNDPNDLCKYFFTGVLIDVYPKMIESVASEIGYSCNAVACTFQGDLDETDEPLPSGMILISHNHFGSALMHMTDFYKTLMTFSKELIKQNLSGNTSEGWYFQMGNALKKLEQKL